MSCSGLSTDKYTLQNVFNKILTPRLKLTLKHIFIWKYQYTMTKLIFFIQTEGVPSSSLVFCVSIHLFIFFINIFTNLFTLVLFLLSFTYSLTFFIY